MRDTAKDRTEIIQHLEAALTLCDAAALPVTAFLIEQALDDVRASIVHAMPRPKAADRQ